MIYRDIQEKDLPEIILIGKNTLEFYVNDNAGFWSEDELDNLMKSKNDCVLVAYDNSISGFIIASFHKPTKKLTIENLYVKKEYRNKNVAGNLLDKCIQKYLGKAKYIISLTHENNIPMNSFLEKNGFEKGYKFNWYTKIIKHGRLK